jgi:hypothetical protein
MSDAETKEGGDEVQRINDLHGQIKALESETGRKSVPLAIEIGRILVETKPKCGHGEWEEWAEINLSFSLRTANRYMALYKRVINDGFDSKGKTLTECYIEVGFIKETAKGNNDEDDPHVDPDPAEPEPEHAPKSVCEFDRCRKQFYHGMDLFGRLETEQKQNILKIIVTWERQVSYVAPLIEVSDNIEQKEPIETVILF